MKSVLLLLLHVLLGTGEARVCEVNARVLGGEYADIEEFPGIVYLERHKQSGFAMCAGSLISDHWVLTAAHCIDLKPGDINIQVYPTKGYDTYIETTDLIVHENFDRTKGYYDIGLIRLPVSMSKVYPFSKTIPLPAQDQPLTSNEVTLVGWGLTSTTENSPLPKHLMKKDHFPLNQDLCRQEYGLSESWYLCSYPTTATGTLCPGDSGGPIYMDGQLVGIVSHTDNLTDATHPTGMIVRIDTRVSAYRNWIDAKIQETTLE